jgi:type IV secretory pathway TraG/TraD family ATPase VirD4
MLMRSVLPHIGKPRPDGSRADRRALVYDAKGDVLSTLHGTAECRIVTLHPFEARGAAWAMGQDITTPAAALQVAAILIPLEQGGSVNPFFRLAAQSLLRGTMLSFLQTVGQDWTFRDVLLALRYEERLRQVLEQTPDGRAILDQFCRRGETLHGIRATLAAHLAAFEVIAAAWDAAPEKVSLREWLAGESILVLGSDEMCRAALDAINRVLFQRLTELILASSESRTRQTWLFLDEVREAGRLEGLGRLLTKGRSKGACVALGFQAIEGMREVYGANVAEEIAGLCNQKIILHLDSPVSAEWASSLFGKREELDRRLSRSRSGRGPFSGLFLTQGSSRTHAESRLMSEALLASEVMTLPPTGPDQGLTGLCLSRGQGAYRQHLTWAQVQALQPVRAVGVADFEPRDEKHQYLREWDQDDFARLGLKPVWQVPTSMPQTGSLPLRVVRESS